MGLYFSIRQQGLKWIDRLTRLRGVGIHVNGMDLRVPGRYWRYYSRDYEKENFRFLAQQLRPGGTCLDIGAHIGLYSVWLAKMNAGQVYAFEPTPRSFSSLLKLIELNGLQQIIHPFPAAMAGQSGTRTFFLHEQHVHHMDATAVDEINSLVALDHGAAIRQQPLTVTTYSIDDFCSIHGTAPTLIKIDAEGAEYEILAGARETFLEHRPSGIIALHRYAYADAEATLQQIWQVMKDYKMQLLHQQVPISQDTFLQLHEKGLLDIQFQPLT